MDDNEREDYDYFNPQYVGCNTCGEMIHCDDYSDEDGNCEDCHIEPEEPSEEDEPVEQSSERNSHVHPIMQQAVNQITGAA